MWSSCNEKKKDPSTFYLLDDHRTDATDKNELQAWQELTLSRLETKSKNTSSIGKAAKGAPRIFRSTPTLRQLMDQYNRPVNRWAPIKCDTNTESGQTSAQSEDFTFDRIRHITVPMGAGGIPGKILRPTKTSK